MIVMTGSVYSENGKTICELIEKGMFGEAAEYLNFVQDRYKQREIVRDSLFFYAVDHGRITLHPAENIYQYIKLKEHYSSQELITDHVILVDPRTGFILKGEKEFIRLSMDPRNPLLAEIEKRIPKRIRKSRAAEC